MFGKWYSHKMLLNYHTFESIYEALLHESTQNLRIVVYIC